MVQPEDREDGAAVDIILKGKRQMKRKYGVVDYLRKHYPPPEGSGEVEVEFLEGYDSIEGPDGSMGLRCICSDRRKDLYCRRITGRRRKHDRNRGP